VSKLTQRRKGERTLLLRLRYSVSLSSRLRGMLTCCCVCQEISNAAKKGREKSLLLIVAEPRSYSSWVCQEISNPAKKGREKSFYTNRGLATFVFELGLSRDFKPSEEGEREELLY